MEHADVGNLPLTLSVQETADELRVSRRTVYALLADKSLRSIKVRGRRVIPRAALREYLTARDAEAAGK